MIKRRPSTLPSVAGQRFLLTLNCLLLSSLILTACAGAPTIPLPDFIAPPSPTSPATTTTQQQAFPPALVETYPPFNSALGHLSPIIFYFNQGMNKPSVEAAFSGLPAGIFTWNDDATAVFTPTAPYPPNSTLKVSIANSIQSATLQPHIKNDEMRPSLRDRVKHSVGIRSNARLVSLIGKNARHEFADIDLVVDHQDIRRDQ